jgi:hypothetical protein
MASKLVNLQVDELSINNGTEVKHVESAITLLGRAQAVGLKSTQLDATARAVQAKAKMELVQAVETYDGRAKPVRSAFERAAKAGVPQLETDALWNVFVGNVTDRLTAATSALRSTVSGNNFEQLGRTIQAAKVFGVSGETGTSVFQEKIEELLHGNNTAAIPAALQFADHAAARIPQSLHGWWDARTHMNTAREEEYSPQALERLLGALQRLREFKVAHHDTEMKDAEATARSWMDSQLQELTGGNDTEMKNVQQFVDLLDKSNGLGLHTTRMDAALRKAQQKASSDLSVAMADYKNEAKRVMAAYLLVQRVHVDGSGAAKVSWTAFLGKASARLDAAASALNSSRSGEHFRELGLSLRAASVLGLPQEGIVRGRSVYEAQLQLILDNKEVGSVDLAVEFSDQASARVPPSLRKWSEAVQRLQEARNWDEYHAARVPQLIHTLQVAQECGLPSSHNDLVEVTSKAKSWSIMQVQEATVGEKATLIQEALAHAERAGVPESELSAARATATGGRRLEF